MSELTKEKIYKRELLKKGATGNNNLERIRSLQNGGGGTVENESGFGMIGNYGLVVPTDNDVYMFGKYDDDNNVDNAIYKVTSGSSEITTLVATLPQAIGETTGIKVGNNIYIFGGFNENAHLYYNSILKFNIETETITTLNVTLPNLMVSRCAFKIGDNVYFFGGEIANGNLDIILKFNITNEAITTLVATLPQTSNFTYALLGGNNIYIYSLRDDMTGIDTLVDLRFNTTNDTLETLDNEPAQ